jgi:hypothetical protein
MATESAPPPQRPRLLSRRRLPDLLLAGFLVILAAAVVVNGIADVRDTRRSRVDKKVAAAWFAQHSTLGRFGPPVVKVHQKRDLACAPRRSANSKIPIDGYCVWIDSSTAKSTGILRSYRCNYVRPGLPIEPEPHCPKAHSDSTGN